jgi:hypothetical protein
VATLQAPHEEILEKDNFAAAIKQPVKGWDKNFQDAYIEALELVKTSDAKVKDVLDRMRAGQTPTYGDLNEIGHWLRGNAKRKTYKMEIHEKGKAVQEREEKLLDNNTDNPLGTAFGTGGIVLPEGAFYPHLPFDGDLKTILIRYQSSKKNLTEPSPSQTHK